MAEKLTNPYCTLRPTIKKKQQQKNDDQLSQRYLSHDCDLNFIDFNPYRVSSLLSPIVTDDIATTTSTSTATTTSTAITNNDFKKLNENINFYCTLKRSTQLNSLPTSCTTNYNINTLPRLTKVNNLCESSSSSSNRTELFPDDHPNETATTPTTSTKNDLLDLSIPVYCTLPRKKNFHFLNNSDSKNTKQNYDNDCGTTTEIYDILKELDIILEEHENNNFNLNIDHCLFDLDCYLDNLLLIDDDNNYNFNNDNELNESSNNDHGNIISDEQLIGVASQDLDRTCTPTPSTTVVTTITPLSITESSESLTNLNNDLFKRQHPLRNTTIGFIQHKCKLNENRNKTENLKQFNELSVTTDLSMDDTPVITPVVTPILVNNNNNQNFIEISTNPLLNFDEPSTSTGVQLRHDPHSTWRRNSMRKTRPILLPEQIPQDSGGGGSDVGGGGFNNHFEDVSSFDQPLGSPPPYFTAIATSGQYTPTATTIGTTTTPNCQNANDFYEAAFGANFYDYGNETRPRQMGRRSDIQPRIVAITAETNQNSGSQRITVCHERPTSVPETTNLVNQISTGISGMTTSAPPITVTNQQQQQHRSSVRFINSINNSEQSSVASSRNPSPVSLISSTGSSGSENVADNNHESLSDGSNRRTTNNTTGVNDDDDTVDDDPDDMYSSVTASTSGTNSNKNIKWPNFYSRSLATVCCTIGIFNLSRFAIFSVHFGANFIVQFLILSFIFGIPLIWLHMCLGSKIKQGPVKMWFISPICVGIGVTLLIGQFFIAIYSSISLSWLLVYFRDSFVTNNEKYRWQEKFTLYRGNNNNNINSTVKLYETIGDYFNGVVLQRYNHIGSSHTTSTNNYLGSVRFQLAFNLAIIWTFIFIILCKNLRSFGKIIPLFTIIPIIGLIIILIKFITIIDINNIDNIIPTPDWDNFFINSHCWLSAAQETFLTWGLFGGTIIKIYSYTSKNIKLKKYQLRNDAIIIVLLTIFILLLASILGTICVQILNNSGYYYLPGSYENILSYVFILPSNKPLPPQLSSIQTKWLQHYSSFVGENYQQFNYNYNKDFTLHAANYNNYNPSSSNKVQESGYQVIRLITEMLPTTIAIMNKNNNFSPVWCLIIFTSLLLFGIGQLCAMWLPIINLFGNYTSSVLLTCIIGLLVGIPLTTENGIVVIHYMDTILGGAWWLLLIWFCYLIAVFLIRGRPYTGDILVNDLNFTETLSAFIAFSWNLLLPIGIIMLSMIEYSFSKMPDFFQWRQYNKNYYWPLWSRQLGCLIQILILLIVPVAAIVQIYRYLSRGPPDILDRIQLLYRPKLSQHANGSVTVSTTGAVAGGTATSASPITLPLDNQLTLLQQQQQQQQDDAPPKYTPPPSYTTATGARLAKMLRNSIRRSVRRILGGEGSNHQINRRQRPQLQQHHQQQISSIATYSRDNDADASPPDYTQIVNNNPSGSTVNTANTIEMGPRPLYNSHTMSLERRLTPFVDISLSREGAAAVPQPQHRLTGNDVATLLRPSGNNNLIKRTASFNVNQLPPQQSQQQQIPNNSDLIRHTINCLHQSRSYENLVLNAAPIGESSFIIIDSDDNRSSSCGDDSRGTITPSTTNTSTNGDEDDEAKNISVI